jgi:phosphate transport system substrate-binding protein
MRIGRFALACALAPLLLLLCPGDRQVRAAAPAGGDPVPLLRITGSSTMCPMIAAIAERYRAVRPTQRIDVQCGGSDRAIKDIQQGNAEIGMVSRTLKADEKGLFGFPMARDGVSIIVHDSNSVTTLTDEQIKGIFSGTIGTWRSINGKDEPIVVVLREAQKPVTELFAKYFDLPGRLTGTVVPGDNPVTIAAVAADPRAIGYVSSGEAVRTAQVGSPIRVIPVGGVLPTSRNVITGNYPITRPLTLITRDLPHGAAKDFINYCLSPKAVDLIEKFDFVPYED